VNDFQEIQPLDALRTNLGGTDRAIRIVAGLAALLLPVVLPIDRPGALALGLFAWVPLVTGLVGWCPIYELFGLSTRRR